MPSRNVETLEWAYDMFNRREWDELLTVFAPDAEWHEADTPDAAVYRGHDGIRHWWEALTEAIPTFRSEPEEFFDAGDSVVVAAALTGAGRESGLDIGGRVGMHWTFREGKIAGCVVRRELNDALEAAGISERR